MRRSSPLPSIILAVLLTAGAGLPGFEPLASSQNKAINLYSITELKAGDNGHFVTRASINNSKITVLIDTGASAVALGYEDAEKVGLKPRTLEFDVRVNTANGEGRAARVMLREVSVGSIRVRNVEGLVLQKGALSGTLLGMSFLGRLKNFEIKDGTLTLQN